MNTQNTQNTQWIEWYEFQPQADTFLCEVYKQETTMQTEGGLILNTEESKVEDRPTAGKVLSIGPDAPYNIGDILFWRKESGYDLGMIRANEEKYILMHPGGVIGKKVTDVRTQDTRGK